jgi:hypothetical protein
MSWAQEEFEAMDLGDLRLNRRAVLAGRAAWPEARGQHSSSVRELGGDGCGLSFSTQ